jgi:hypothetical protein
MIRADGTVTAVGKSALIMPPEGCVWAPDKPFGSAAAGPKAVKEWSVPIVVPARYWVASSIADGFVASPAFVF